MAKVIYRLDLTQEEFNSIKDKLGEKLIEKIKEIEISDKKIKSTKKATSTKTEQTRIRFLNALVELKKQQLEATQYNLKKHFGISYKTSKKYYELLVDKTVSGSLSQSALETLAIIAYNEPITVGQIDEIRGVSSRDMVRKLLFKGLIDVAGKSDLPGKPMLYKTTNKFLDYFNLSSKDELPEINMNEEISEEEKDLFISKYKEK